MNSVALNLFLATIGIACMARATRKGLAGRGRVITSPMRDTVLRFSLRKPNKKLRENRPLDRKDFLRLVKFAMLCEPGTFRYTFQIFPSLLLATGLVWITNLAFNYYWVWYIVLFLDDLLTGDTDKWKKLWGWLKNKIKWRIFVPSPARMPG